MEQPVPIKEVKILETAEDIQERREQVRKFFLFSICHHQAPLRNQFSPKLSFRMIPSLKFTRLTNIG